jgi:hypothetical protein
MVVSSITPKDFFIYGNGKKLWVVIDNQIIEIKNYMIDSFNFTMDRNCQEVNLIGGDSFNIFGRPDMTFDLHAQVVDASFINKENVDVSDFYDMEECKTLSKIIQRKFDKILEESKDD